MQVDFFVEFFPFFSVKPIFCLNLVGVDFSKVGLRYIDEIIPNAMNWVCRAWCKMI